LIEDKDSKKVIPLLYKKHSLEIDWKDSNKGEVLGVEVKQERKDGTFYPRTIGESVIFEDKNGKKYQICVKISEIRKSFWRDKVISYGFFVFSDESYKLFMGKEKEHTWRADFVNKGWHFGKIILAFIGIVFLVAGFLAWFIWSRE